MLNIVPIPALKDNYIWLIIDTAASCCLIVDPGEAAPVVEALKAHSVTPVGVLLTHHHADHTAGLKELLKIYTMPVFGAKQEAIPTITHPLVDEETLPIINHVFKVLAIPGHTHGHVAYYGAGTLFCGDTLFTGGCGKVFEGTMIEMYTSLQRLATLPENTQVYCGHEYTEANLSFAQRVEPQNPNLQQRIKDTQALRKQNLPTVPSTLALEKTTNPFLRCAEKEVKKAAEHYCGYRLETSAAVFAVLREWKNSC